MVSKGLPDVLLKEMKGYGGKVHGSDADYVIATENNAFPLPDELSFEEGAFLGCNAGTAYQCGVELRLSADDTVAIYGLGPVGLCALLVAKARGSRVIGVDPVADRRKLAEELGADAVLDGDRADVTDEVKRMTGGEGAEAALDLTGVPVARQSGADGRALVAGDQLLRARLYHSDGIVDLPVEHGG